MNEFQLLIQLISFGLQLGYFGEVGVLTTLNLGQSRRYLLIILNRLVLLRWCDLNNGNLLLLLLLNLLHLRIDLHDKVRIVAVPGHMLPNLFEFEELVVLFLIYHGYLLSYPTGRKARRLSSLNFLATGAIARPQTTTARSTKEAATQVRMSANERVCS